MENERIKILEIKEEALSIPDQAKAIQVVDDETLNQANEFVNGCRSMLKRIGNLMDPIIKRDHEMHMADIADKRALEDPWLKAKNLVTPQIISYRRKLEEEKRALEEAARLEVEKKQREEEELLKKAAEAESKGEVEEADEIFEQAEAIAEAGPGDASIALKETPEPQKIRGVSTRKIWKWRLKNIKEVPRSHMILDEKKLNHEARNYREGETAEIPGIEFYWV